MRSREEHKLSLGALHGACSLLLSLLVGLLPSCQPSAGPAAATQELVVEERPFRVEDGLLLFTELNLRNTLDKLLPEAVSAADEATARRLCDYSRARLRAFETEQMPASLASLQKELGAQCETQVATIMLNRQLKDLNASDGELRSQRCEGARIAVGFLFMHNTEEPTVVALREELFSLCPALREMWEQAKQGGPPPESAP